MLLMILPMTPCPDKVPVSVLIPAKNEERNLPACLASLERATEIFVVDSQSRDRTAAIATAAGAQVVQFQFSGDWPKKKNWALDHLPFSHEWVLIVDCDERIPPDLWDEIATAIHQSPYDGYYLNRRVWFLGTWIRHGGKYPDWNLRLFRHRQGRYENLHTADIPNTGDNEVHEHVIIEGAVGYLRHDIIHEDLRDLYHWLARHNRYSNWEARVYYNLLTGRDRGDTISPNLFGNPVQRKRFLKTIWVRLPCRPLLRFWLVYGVQLGFLDGRAGYIYARLLSQYESQIGIKLLELRRFGGQLNPGPAEPSHPPINPGMG